MQRPVLLAEAARIGDEVALWRFGSGGGAVATGVVSEEFTEAVRVPPPLLPLRRPRVGAGPEPAYRIETRLRMRLDRLFLDDPVPDSALKSIGIDSDLFRERTARGDPIEGMAIHLSAQQWADLSLAIDRPREHGWPVEWNLTPGTVVQRSQFHGVFGGNSYLKYAHSASTPNSFLVVSFERHLATLRPRWEDGALIVPGATFWVESEGEWQPGAALHLRCGRPLRVFESSGAEMRYAGQFVIDQTDAIHDVCTVQSKFQENKQYRRATLIRLLPVDENNVDLEGASSYDESSRAVLTVIARPPRESVESDAAEPSPGMDPSVVETAERLAQLLLNHPAAAAQLSQLPDVQVLSAVLEHARRQQGIERLRALVAEPGTTEHSLQKALEEMIWIFGGEFLPDHARRVLTAGEQLDFTLVRPDGSIHGVEIKKANIPYLVKRGPGEHVLVGAEVSDAVGQAMNYLRSLDEERDHILARWSLDARRASMTVVIGYTPLCGTGVTAREITETLRTYNSHLTRVRVVTYDGLLDAAEQIMRFVSPQDDPAA